MNMIARIRESEPVHCITCRHWMALNPDTGLCWKNDPARSAALRDRVETDREDGCSAHSPIKAGRIGLPLQRPGA